jgi:hypothetical protein
MALKRDHSDLPPDLTPPGFPPDEVPRYGMRLAQAWADRDIPDGELAFAIPDTRWRLSWAGKCARDLGYWLKGETPSNPMSIADHWRTGLGKMVHSALQGYFTEAYPGAEVEHVVDLRDLSEPLNGSGHIDIYVVKPSEAIPKTTVIEVKTINGFGFKRAIGARGQAEGPRSNALRQAAMEAYSVGAEELVIVYLSLELLSPQEFAKLGGVHEVQKFLAEWTLLPEQYEKIAKHEIMRVRKVIELVDENLLPPRSIPDLPRGARVTDPERGTWQIKRDDGSVTDTGSTWMCGYCANRDRCIEDGAS